MSGIRSECIKRKQLNGLSDVQDDYKSNLDHEKEGGGSGLSQG